MQHTHTRPYSAFSVVSRVALCLMLAACVVINFPQRGDAAAPFIDSGSIQNGLSLLPYLEYLSDPSGELTIRSFSAPDPKNVFRPFAQGRPVKLSGTTWLRFTIMSPDKDTWGRHLRLDLGNETPAGAALYEKMPGADGSQGSWATHKAMDNSVFVFRNPSSPEAVIYLRLPGAPGLWFSPTLSSAGPAAAQSSLAVQHGGMMQTALAVALILVTLIAFLRAFSKGGEWRVWTGIISFLGLVVFCTPVPVMPEGVMTVWGGCKALAAGIALLIFFHTGRHMMRTAEDSPTADALLRIFCIAAAVLTLYSFIPGQSWFLRYTVLWPLLAVVGIIPAFLCFRRASYAASRYLIACLILCAGAIMALSAAGKPAPNALLVNAPYWAVFLACFLMAVPGLSGAKRKNTLKEKEEDLSLPVTDAPGEESFVSDARITLSPKETHAFEPDPILSLKNHSVKECGDLPPDARPDAPIVMPDNEPADLELVVTSETLPLQPEPPFAMKPDEPLELGSPRQPAESDPSEDFILESELIKTSEDSLIPTPEQRSGFAPDVVRPMDEKTDELDERIIFIEDPDTELIVMREPLSDPLTEAARKLPKDEMSENGAAPIAEQHLVFTEKPVAAGYKFELQVESSPLPDRNSDTEAEAGVPADNAEIQPESGNIPVPAAETEKSESETEEEYILLTEAQKIDETSVPDVMKEAFHENGIGDAGDPVPDSTERTALIQEPETEELSSRKPEPSATPAARNGESEYAPDSEEKIMRLPEEGLQPDSGNIGESCGPRESENENDSFETETTPKPDDRDFEITEATDALGEKASVEEGAEQTRITIQTNAAPGDEPPHAEECPAAAMSAETEPLSPAHEGTAESDNIFTEEHANPEETVDTGATREETASPLAADNVPASVTETVSVEANSHDPEKTETVMDESSTAEEDEREDRENAAAHSLEPRISELLRTVEELKRDSSLSPEAKAKLDALLSAGRTITALAMRPQASSGLDEIHSSEENDSELDRDMEPEQFNLHELLHGICRELAELAEKHAVILSCEVSPWLPQGLKGNAPLLRKTVFRLLRDCIRCAEHGNVRLLAEPASEEADPGHITLKIAASGFEGGARFHPDPEGMAIAWEAVARCGGKLLIDTEADQSATISLDLRFSPSDPARESERAEETAEDRAAPQTPTEQSGKESAEPVIEDESGVDPERFSKDAREVGEFRDGEPLGEEVAELQEDELYFDEEPETQEDDIPEEEPVIATHRSILVADSLAANRQVFGFFLEGLPFTVVEARNLDEARARYRFNPTSIVLVEPALSMRGIETAIGFFHDLDEEAGRIPAPVVSLINDPDQAEAMLDAGCADTLLKPFSRRATRRLMLKLALELDALDEARARAKKEAEEHGEHAPASSVSDARPVPAQAVTAEERTALFSDPTALPEESEALETPRIAEASSGEDGLLNDLEGTPLEAPTDAERTDADSSDDARESDATRDPLPSAARDNVIRDAFITGAAGEPRPITKQPNHEENVELVSSRPVLVMEEYDEDMPVLLEDPLPPDETERTREDLEPKPEFTNIVAEPDFDDPMPIFKENAGMEQNEAAPYEAFRETQPTGYEIIAEEPFPVEPERTRPFESFPLSGANAEGVDRELVPLIPELIKNLTAALRDASRGKRDDEPEAVEKACHRLASVAGMHGLKATQRIASCVERAAEARDREAIADLLSELELTVNRNIKALERQYARSLER